MHSSYQGGDPAGYPQASVGFDYDEVDENIALHEGRQAGQMLVEVTMTAAEALIKLLAYILDGTDYRLRAEIAAAGSGLALCQGWSYTEMAKRHGITKQAFDKHVLKFQKDFNLPVTRSQKSPQARLSYRKTQLDRQERLRLTNAATKERTELVWQNSSRRAPKVQSES